MKLDENGMVTEIPEDLANGIMNDGRTEKEVQRAINFIHAYMHPTSDSEYEQRKRKYRDMAIKALEQQSSITTTPYESPAWIRITDRMPESGKDVLFCDIDGDIYLGHYNSQHKYWWPGDFGDHIKNVIAWMPLPEPYKEDEDTITVPVDKIYVLTKDDIKDIDPEDDIFKIAGEELKRTIELVKEDEEKFIFNCIAPFLAEINEIVIPKEVLVRALTTFREEHTAEWKVLTKKYGGTV